MYYVSHTRQRQGYKCKKKTKQQQKKRHKDQLKMMEDEQNLRKILAKVHWQKCPKKYI